MKPYVSTRTVEITLERLTPVQQHVAAALLQGATISGAADSAGVHRNTVHNWCSENPAFRAALDAARRMHAQYIADETRDLVEEALIALRELIQSGVTKDGPRLRAIFSVLDRAGRVAVHHRDVAAIEYAKLQALHRSIPVEQFERTRDAVAFRKKSPLRKSAKR